MCAAGSGPLWNTSNEVVESLQKRLKYPLMSIRRLVPFPPATTEIAPEIAPAGTITAFAIVCPVV
jgi:hypothetical protein